MQKPSDELVSETFFSLIAYFHTKIFFKEECFFGDVASRLQIF